MHCGGGSRSARPRPLDKHKGAKAANHVAVYPTRDVTPWLARLAGERIHRAEQIAVQVIDAALVAQLAARLERRMEFDLSITEGTLYLSLGEETLTGSVQQVPLPQQLKD